MLRFLLHPLYVLSLGRHFLPLPKIAESQLAGLSIHLQERGFGVRPASSQAKLVAETGTQRIALDGALGHASPLQIGRSLYDRSAIPVSELLSSLRTVGSGAAD